MSTKDVRMKFLRLFYCHEIKEIFFDSKKEVKNEIIQSRRTSINL